MRPTPAPEVGGNDQSVAIAVVKGVHAVLVPSTRQSADHCYHGHITKAGSAQTRWMLTQGVQHIAVHPGPLGVFFRRLCKRKNRNVAISAVARKLVTIAYLMLRNNEPYRYAVAKRVHEKFTTLGSRATGKPARTPPGTAPRDLPHVYARHGLPVARRPDQLPSGERRMLVDKGVDQVVQTPCTARKRRSTANHFFTPQVPADAAAPRDLRRHGSSVRHRPRPQDHGPQQQLEAVITSASSAVGSAIPCRVASPQSPTPLHRARSAY